MNGDDPVDGKMLKIAVFDPDAADCAATARAVREYFEKEQISSEVLMFYAYARRVGDWGGIDENLDRDLIFIGANSAAYDMVFVGVDSLRSANIGGTIKEAAPDCPLFFVSHTIDYGVEAVRIRALDYMIKPVTPEGVGNAVRRIRENN